MSLSAYSGEVNEEFLSQFSVVVFTDCYDRDYLVNMNAVLREKKIGFIWAGNVGLFGYTFVDFGD